MISADILLLWVGTVKIIDSRFTYQRSFRGVEIEQSTYSHTKIPCHI